MTDPLIQQAAKHAAPAHSQVPLIHALERLYAELADEHELPPVVITIGSGVRPRGAQALGTFYPEMWLGTQADPTPEAYVHQINIGAEGLQRGARDVAATLIHEAVHAHAKLKGIQDTSRQGRYHNKRFKELGEEFGLELDKDESIGWSLTTMPDATADRYSAIIADIDKAITHYRVIPVRLKAPTIPAAVCECEPQRKIRVSPRTLFAAPITCGQCEADFTIPGLDPADFPL